MASSSSSFLFIFRHADPVGCSGRYGFSLAEVKKSFRKLALEYHPDVCKGSNCKVEFQSINEAYDVVMSSLREESMEI